MRKLSAGLAGVAGIALITFLPGAASAQGVGFGGGYGVDGGGFGTLNVMAGAPGGIPTPPTPPGGPGAIPTPPTAPTPPMTPEPPMGAPILPGPPSNPGAPGFIPTPGDIGGAPTVFPGRVQDRFSQVAGRATLPGAATGAPLPPSFGIWSAGSGVGDGAGAAPTPTTGAPAMPAALTARFGLLPSNATTRIPTSVFRR